MFFFKGTACDIVVTWSTRNFINQSICAYGYKDGDIEFRVENPKGPKKFEDGGKAKKTQYIHRVAMENLEERQCYKYRCGSLKGWSTEYWFCVQSMDVNWSPMLAIYGDLGNENARSLPRLQEESQIGMYDAIIHAGDMAYDMATDDGTVGDAFMNQIEPIAAFVPYMVAPGNHEHAYNFSHYRERFTMPGSWENLFYSFNLGPVHFVSISTELYYYLNYGIKPLIMQYKWLINDLEKANSNRNRHPWIITYGHRPMYCSNDNGDDCSKYGCVLRKGLPVLNTFGLEDVFYEYGVDVSFWGHEHCYERLWPIYNYTVYNGSFAEPYRNPKAPIHITTGAAGNKEGREPFDKRIPHWSAFHSQNYGYTRLKVVNFTHLYIEQVSIDHNGDIIDHFWIIKDKHGPYKQL